MNKLRAINDSLTVKRYVQAAKAVRAQEARIRDGKLPQTDKQQRELQKVYNAFINASIALDAKYP